MHQPEPVVLEGDRFSLEPLSLDHAGGLYNRGQTAADWDFLPRPCFVDLADCKQWIEHSLLNPEHCCFALIEKHSGRAIGSSRYMNIRSQHNGLEIGYTWLGSDWQETAANPEMKLLLLDQAFALGAMRVEFKTDARNARSQAALRRLGAVREGVRRQHMLAQGDVRRDSVYFSILDHEWPAIRLNLVERLQALF